MAPDSDIRLIPIQVDNDLRLQLLGRVGYFYADRTGDTGPNLVLPPDTMLYGVKLRGRYDGMRRNLLELPHTGIAAGFDVDYMYRDKWANFGTIPDAFFSKEDTGATFRLTAISWVRAEFRDYQRKTGFSSASTAAILPRRAPTAIMPLRSVVVLYPVKRTTSAAPIIQGPCSTRYSFQTMLCWPLEYRRELASFLYLQLRETLIWADRAAVTDTNKFLFKSSTGAATTIGMDTGFFWNSALYIGYSWDSGFIRNGKSGSGLILTWSKAF